MIQRNFPVPAWPDLKTFAPQPLSETVRNAAQGLLLRTVKGARIESVSVAEIRTEL